MRPTAAWALALVIGMAGCGSAAAQGSARLELFDAHLHYNQEPNPFYPLEKVLEVFRRNGVTGMLATSRPNKGTHQLMDAKAPGLWVVPFIRPYRTRSDIQTWFNDPGDLRSGPTNISAAITAASANFTSTASRRRAEVKKIVNFAVERNLYLHAHCDEEALLHPVRA